MTLPDGSKVRYLAVMATSSDGLIIIKELQVFQCARKFYVCACVRACVRVRVRVLVLAKCA